MTKIGRLLLVAVASAALIALVAVQFNVAAMAAEQDAPAATTQPSGLPKLLDLGSTECIPCKLMAPILEELKKDYAGRFEVEVVNVGIKENLPLAQRYGITLIPTQIFFDAVGKELWRHENFLGKDEILAKWKELGYDFGGAALPGIERWATAKADDRPKDQVCYMCDGDIDAKTAVVVQTDKGEVRLCSPHCYFILYSCLTQDKAGFEQKVSVTDYATGKPVAAAEAVCLYGLDEKTGRPWVKVFANREVAAKEMQAAGGSILSWPVLRETELSHRCGFCDRACYPQDAAEVLIDGVQSWGCCSHCAMGVAVRTGKDIEVRQPDGLTHEMVTVKTRSGSVASIEPATAVAWFGQKKTADGKWVSAGCFHQGFFTTPENLGAWLQQHPLETGAIITIQQALADKMKLSPQQIQKACKIGQCAPK